MAAVDKAFVQSAEGNATGTDTSDAVAEIDEAGNETAVSNSDAVG